MLIAPHADVAVVLTAKQRETLKGNNKWLEKRRTCPQHAQLPAPTFARANKRQVGYGNGKGPDQISGAASRETRDQS
jgi:hypothetical protein